MLLSRDDAVDKRSNVVQFRRVQAKSVRSIRQLADLHHMSALRITVEGNPDFRQTIRRLPSLKLQILVF